MKRAQYDQRGPDPQASIQSVEFTLPELTAGQALLEVLAAPINPSDVLTLTGLYGMLPPLPAVGGNEGVGKVVALGPDTKGPAIGQTVLLPVGCGSWATHVLAEAKTLMPLPNEADPLQLAMMTVNPPTASLMLSERMSARSSEIRPSPAKSALPACNASRAATTWRSALYVQDEASTDSNRVPPADRVR